MSLVSDRLLAAAFFIPKENQQQNQSIEVLLKKAGATNINRPPNRVIECQWGGMLCQAYTYNELLSYQLFVIEFMMGTFYEGIPIEDSDLPLEEDGNLQVALAFRNACEALKPEVAYIATRLPYGEFEKIVENVKRIEAYDPHRILDEAGLLYLRGIIADCLVDPPPEDAPDTLPVSEGVLIFGGQGSKRWW